ncbi:bactofilin family protein [Phorcysia thermohydrogeniphila]|uniref:bactofilin family protein n=1 Tax=Phorcysia thermohydrogeniphila TaxID=936138 RepID=UPI00104720B8|nr:polymer-forming cytoskeletal protein [Phorcysia thermohydrogeniphila]
MLKRKESENIDEIKSILAEGLKIEGNIYAEGKIRIDGEVTGDVRGKFVILGQSSKINGNVYAEVVVAMGNIEGNVEAKKLDVKASAKIKGDVVAENFSVEPGASLHGLVKVGSYREFSENTLESSSAGTKE